MDCDILYLNIVLSLFACRQLELEKTEEKTTGESAFVLSIIGVNYMAFMARALI